MFLLNAFSIQMLNGERNLVLFEELTESRFLEMKEGAVSAIGHPDTARVLGVEPNRVSVKLHPGEKALVAQLQGGRLPEGATKLPDGFHFRYYLVEVVSNQAD